MTTVTQLLAPKVESGLTKAAESYLELVEDITDKGVDDVPVAKIRKTLADIGFSSHDLDYDLQERGNIEVYSTVLERSVKVLSEDEPEPLKSRLDEIMRSCGATGMVHFQTPETLELRKRLSILNHAAARAASCRSSIESAWMSFRRVIEARCRGKRLKHRGMLPY